MVVRVTSGTEIRPDERPWVGSLGYAMDGYLLTNEHVAPYEGEEVHATKLGALIGRVARVAKIRTVSLLDILLNLLFNVRLPVNELDVAAIDPEPNVRYEKFTHYPEVPVVAQVGDRVYSLGRTSGYREGVVTSTHATITVNVGGKIAIFDDCIEVAMPVAPGDSGSAVVSDRGIVGLVFAGTADGTRAYVIKATNIARWLAR